MQEKKINLKIQNKVKSLVDAIFRIKRFFAKDDRIPDFKNINKIVELHNIEASRLDMIRGVLNLSKRIVREIMIPRVDVVAVNVDIPFKELVKKVYEAGYSRLPVYKESIDHIIGVLHAKDLLRFLIEKPGKFNLKRLIKKPFFVPETMPLDDLLREFKKRKRHIAIAVDEYGGLGGIVTLEDILEEIVGDISDEFDTDEKPEFQKRGKDTFEADPRMPLEDFCNELGVNLPVKEFDTLGGFVMDLFGGIPQKDQSVNYENLTFKILEIAGTRINRIGITVSRKRSNFE
ncbi:MAG: hemolysin family protein [Spirochaetes bacterium]|nr:hemolysin family protein [Spirochaetota bacterium]